MDQRERFEQVVERFAGRDGVEMPDDRGGRRFGSDALKVHGSIFAMVSGAGGFIVKLPADRVSTLVAQDAGIRWDANKGRPMREWLEVAGTDEARWLQLAEEAFAYVGSLRR